MICCSREKSGKKHTAAFSS